MEWRGIFFQFHDNRYGGNRNLPVDFNENFVVVFYMFHPNWICSITLNTENNFLNDCEFSGNVPSESRFTYTRKLMFNLLLTFIVRFL